MRNGISRLWGFHRDVRAVTTLLREVVRRVVQAADPDEIILFGSTVRGQLRRDSDFDLLVVKSGVDDREQLKRQIQINFFGLPIPIDVIVVTPEDLKAARRKQWTFLYRAMSGGRRIYSRAQKSQVSRMRPTPIGSPQAP